jgi:hypothetical protein
MKRVKPEENRFQVGIAKMLKMETEGLCPRFNAILGNLGNLGNSVYWMGNFAS